MYYLQEYYSDDVVVAIGESRSENHMTVNQKKVSQICK